MPEIQQTSDTDYRTNVDLDETLIHEDVVSINTQINSHQAVVNMLHVHNLRITIIL